LPQSHGSRYPRCRALERRLAVQRYRTTGLRCCVLDDDAGDNGPGQCVQKRKELLQFVETGVGDVDDVLVLDSEALSEEIGVRVAHIEAVDDWRTAIGPCAQLGSIERGHDGRGLEAEEKHPRRIRTQVLQSSSLGNRLGQSNPLGVEGDLRVLPGGAKH